MSGNDRESGNFIRAYAEYCKEAESPDSFHIWSSLSIIASAARRNVWVDQGIFTLYPNMFVVLVGPPGKVSKSTAIRLGRTLLLANEDIFFGPDSQTREDLINLMARAGAVHGQSALTIHSTELSSLIEPSGIKMIQFLTDIYDNDHKWRYSTKSSGKDTIKMPVLNILAGTTPSWIAEGLPVDVVGHGFTSRVIFVYEDMPRFLNSRPKGPEKAITQALMRDLERISELEGPFTITPDADRLYDRYYHKVYEDEPDDYRIEGYYWRKAKAHLLKVAMLYSLAESDDLVIRSRDVQLAWETLGATETNMHKTFSAVGKYSHAADLERVLKQIVKSGGMTSQEIYSRNFAVGDINDVAGIVTMLLRTGKVSKSGEKFIAVDSPGDLEDSVSKPDSMRRLMSPSAGPRTEPKEK